jgi:hypothetical protein
MALLLVVQWWNARSRRKTGTHFSGSRFKNLEFDGAHFPEKGSPANGPGTPYALRRNIFRKRQKTMVCLAVG